MKYAKTIRALPAEEGEPDTVICLAFMLGIGDIQEAIDSSYSLCGLCFLCDWMKPYNNPVSAVELPKYRTNGSRAVSCQSWGEVSHDEFRHFLPLERPFSSGISWANTRRGSTTGGMPGGLTHS